MQNHFSLALLTRLGYTVVMKDEIKSLGYANGENTELDNALKACEAQGHQTQRTYVSPRGDREQHTCPICKFSFMIDMS